MEHSMVGPPSWLVLSLGKPKSDGSRFAPPLLLSKWVRKGREGTDTVTKTIVGRDTLQRGGDRGKEPHQSGTALEAAGMAQQ